MLVRKEESSRRRRVEEKGVARKKGDRAIGVEWRRRRLVGTLKSMFYVEGGLDLSFAGAGVSWRCFVASVALTAVDWIFTEGKRDLE